MLAAWPGADAPLARAVHEDPEFAAGHAALGRLHQIYGRTAVARECIARARRALGAATERERSHVEILGAAIEGAGGKALQALPSHLDQWPRDALVLSLALGAFGLHAFSGRPDHDAARVALCERLRASYGEDWWFLTHLGWSHTEAQNLREGETHTVRALELRPANAHAAHALAHRHAEAGELGKGAAFIEDWLSSYPASGTLYSHLNWHRTLALQAAGKHDEALALYLESIRPGRTQAPPLNVVSDAAALLWRASLSGAVSGELWREVAASATATFPGPAPHFAEWHIAMALAGADERAALDARIASVREREASGTMPTGGAVEAVCKGLAAFGRGDWRGAIAQLEPNTKEFVRLGGSGAQRKILHDTLVAARLRSSL